MVKRVRWQSTFYLVFAIILMILSWEHNRSEAAIVDGGIPEQSIRLRILANSDSLDDQALKRRVRDVIVANMNSWVQGPQTIDGAREVVRSHLDELTELAHQEIVKEGYSYTVNVELGIVPFPAKMYGNKVYPAGDYEALRVTIGEGAGQNWWCVLFPALCFVDGASGEAVEKDPDAAEAGMSKAEKAKAEKAREAKEAAIAAKAAKDAKDAKNAKVKQAKAEKAEQSEKIETEGKPAKASVKVAKLSVGSQNGDAAGKVQAGMEQVESEIRTASCSHELEGMKKADLEVNSKKQVRFYLWDKLRSLF